MRGERILVVLMTMVVGTTAWGSPVPLRAHAVGPQHPSVGPICSVIQDGRYVFASALHGLLVYDMDADRPGEPVSCLVYENGAGAGHLVGQYIFTDGSVVDVSDPRRPVSVELQDMEPQDLWGVSMGLVGDVLYRGVDPWNGSPRLEAWDYADPLAPVLLRTLLVGADPDIMIIDDGRLLRHTGNWLECRDASAPDALPMLGNLDLGDAPLDLRRAVCREGLLYLHAGDLIIVDVRDPQRMEVVGRLELEPWPESPPVLDGDRLYLMSRPSHDRSRVDVVDVSDPAVPRLLASPEHMILGTDPPLIAARNGFVLEATPLRMVLKDFADPSQPVEVASDDYSGGGFLGIVDQRGYFSYAEGRLMVADLAHPNAPVRFHGLYRPDSWFLMTGSTLYAVGFDLSGAVYDVLPASRPVRIGMAKSVPGTFCLDTEIGPVSVSGSRLSGWDVSDPLAPQTAWELETELSIGSDLPVCEDRLYFAGGGVIVCHRLVDGIPSERIATHMIPESRRIQARNVAPGEDVVYGIGDTGLSSWRFRDGSADPEPETEFGPDHAHAALLHDDRLLVLHGESGLQVFDVGHPHAPALVADYALELPEGVDLEHRDIHVVGDDVLLVGGRPVLLHDVLTDAVANEDVLIPAPSGPARLVLDAPHPNPFNPQTDLAFDLPIPGHVRLDIHDVRGRCVRSLLDERRPAGHHGIPWNGRGDDGRELPSGVYLARLRAGDEVRTIRMTLSR